MIYRILSVFFLASILFIPFAGQAGEVVACGVPVPAGLQTDTGASYCDIYQRKLAYRTEALKQAELIKERQKNYIAPQREARRRYESDMEALNAHRTPSEAP